MEQKGSTPRVAVIGTGDWGKNLVRNFHNLGSLAVCCDADQNRLNRFAGLYPDIRTTTKVEDVLDDSEIEGVVVAAPAVLHYEIAKKCLQANKHVYVEKPLALKVEHGQELVDLANAAGRKLMVGHLLLYHPAVKKMKTMVDAGELGSLYYITSRRTNLGKVRHDENALWSLAPHDVSVILYLFQTIPSKVTAAGKCFIQKDVGIEDVVFVNLGFADGRFANIQVSWLDPHKIRQTVVVGSQKMVVFDDDSPSEKLRIYDKGVDTKWQEGRYISYADALTLRTGDINIPHVPMTEPLKIECEHFLDCIRNDSQPLTDGRNGLDVLRVLDASQRSLDAGGQPISIEQ
jgi:predicted dehydrogenase